MHFLMFEEREYGLGAIEEGMSRPIEVGVRQGINHAMVDLVDKRPNLATGRPGLSGLSASLIVRIDAAGEQCLEPRIDARSAKGPLDQRIEAEAGQMAFVKDDRMPQRNRLSVIRFI